MDQRQASATEMRTLFRTLLPAGHTILLADARHPGHQGLPEGHTADILRVDFTPDNFVSLDDPEFVELRYLQDTGTATARLAWDGCFFLTGTSAADANERVGLVGAHLPDYLEPDRETNLNRLLAGMGLVPRGQAAEWNLDVRPSVLADDADRSDWCPDKREALQRTLARSGMPALLWFDAAVPGVVLPPSLRASGQVEVHVGQAAGSRDVQMTQFALAWSLDAADGPQRITLPWRSIGAVRDTKTGLGWWWPRDLHPAARATFEGHPELWPVLERLDGIPMAAPPPGPAKKLSILVMQQPLAEDKVAALRRLLAQGLTIVLADPACAGVRLPPSLPGRARVLMVPLQLPGLDPRVRWDDDGLGALSPDYDGVVREIWLPWRAIFLLAGSNGLPHSWPDDFPPFLVAAQHALRAVQHSDGGDLPPELEVFDFKPQGDGLGLGLTKGPDGRHLLVVGRPLGNMPPPPGSAPGQRFRSTMQLSFVLPPPPVQ